MKYQCHRCVPCLLTLLCAISVRSNAGDFYVDRANPNASDNNPGNVSSPWLTLAKANQTLRAGDTVYIKAGTYNTSVSPVGSGTATASITYKNNASDIVTIAGAANGIVFAGKSFVVISGINFTNNGTFFDLTSSTNCVITNCVFKGMLGTSAWSGGKLIGSSQRNRIQNCTFERWGYFTSNDDIGDLLDFGDEYNLTDFTWYNVIEGCKISAAAHSLLNLRSGRTIIRNNYFHNEIWSNGHGGRCIISDAPVETGGWNLFESNRIAFAAAAPDATAGSGINLRTRNSIVRYNVFYNNTDAGVFMDGGDATSDHALWNHIYANTFFKNGIATSDSQASIALQNYGTAFQVKSNSIMNNIMRSAPKVFFVSGSGVSLSQQTIAGNWQEAGDPLFVDVVSAYGPTNPSLPDFRLKTNSPCIDAGVFLTAITSASGSGRTFQVADPNFFMDGWGMTQGDVVQLQGSAQRAIITNVNYSTRMIMVDSNLTWYQNQGVSLPYRGSAPDIGAFEFGSGLLDTNEAPVVTTGASQTINFPVNIAALTGAANDSNHDPLTFDWSQITGPASASFSTISFSNTMVTVTDRGEYVFRLTVSDGKASSFADTTVTFAPDPSTIMFEAENGSLTAPFVVQGGAIVQNSLTSVANGGRAAFVFSVPLAGDYLVKGNVNAPDESANSFFVNVDAEPIDPTMIWDIPVTTGFESRTVSWRGAGTPQAPKLFSLNAGSHTLVVRGREPGVELDRIEIMSANSSSAQRLVMQTIPSTHKVVVSWPAAAANYVLETSSSLSSGALWTPLTNGVVTSGNNNMLTNDVDAPAAFYRLRKQ